MNKSQAIDYARIIDTLRKWGFDRKEADALLRIEKTLRRWHLLECNGNLRRDGEDETGKPRYWFQTQNGEWFPEARNCPDRESSAHERLAGIMTSHVAYAAYVQTDPRGCALYIVPVSELTDGANVDSVYTRGLAICY